MKKLCCTGIWWILTLSVFAQYDAYSGKLENLMMKYQFAEAIKICDSILVQDSLPLEIWHYKAKASMALYNYKQVLICYRKMCLADSTNATFWAGLAEAYRNSGEPNSAVYAWYFAMRHDSLNQYYKVKFAETQMLAGDMEGALTSFQFLLKRDPQNIYLLEQTGNCLENIGITDSACHYYRAVIMVDSLDRSAISKLVNLCITLNRFEEGIAVSERYLRTDSLNTGMIKQNAYLFYLSKNYDKAEERFLQCIRGGDDGKFTNKYLALSYYRQEKYDLAEKFFQRAFRNDTTDAETCFYLGIAAVRSFEKDTGILFLNRSIRLLDNTNKLMFNAWLEFSSIYTGERDYKKALDYLQKAWVIQPENPLIMFRMAYHYDTWLKDVKNALLFYNDFLKATGDVNQESEFYPFVDLAKERVHEIGK